MNRWIANALGISLIAAVGLTVYGGYVLERHLLPVVDSYAATDTLGKFNAVLDNINAPCKGFHGSVTCGTLAQIDQTTKNIGIVAGQSALQVKQTGALITATANNLNAVGESVKGVASHLDTTADALTGTSTAATGTLQQAKADLATLDTTIAAGKPLLDAATITVAKAGDTADSLNDILKDKAINQTIDNTAVISGNFAATTTDFQTKFHTLLFPPPCHTFGCRLGKIFEILKQAGSLAEPAYWGAQTFKAVTK